MSTTGTTLTATALIASSLATVAVGAYRWRVSRTTSDFLVASRTVPPHLNAAAISGEYLSAASFLGVAGLISKYGADALWYPVGFTAGYLGLLLFVSAPLRRSGAYTVPDFAEFRLNSPLVRRISMTVVVTICVLYLVPQYQGAGLTLRTLLGLPTWVGPLAVSGIIIANVVGGGMRSITFVQAFQYWLKLTAIAVPAIAIAILAAPAHHGFGGPLPPIVNSQTEVRVETDTDVNVIDPTGVTITGTLDGGTARDSAVSAGRHTIAAGSTVMLAAGSHTPVIVGAPVSGSQWAGSGTGVGGKHPLYQILSIIIATFLGAMGLPHVLVRFYTNPDGRAARRSALAVIALLGFFYLFPTLLGGLARMFVPQLLITGKTDAAVLLLPSAAIAGLGGQLIGALVAAGAIAAFLATSSGLLVTFAGAVSTDLLRGRVRDFRSAAIIGGLAPIPLAVAASAFDLSRGVGLVFAVAASTLCPLLVLGIWWRGLTAAGATAGLIVGAVSSAVAALLAVTSWVGDDVLGGWPAAVVGYPGAVTVPLAFTTMVVVSRLTRSSVPAGISQVFARMHLPERMGMGIERAPAPNDG